MNYSFPDVDPNTEGAVYNVPVPLSRYLGASFEAAQHDTVLSSLNRMSEMSLAEAEEDSPILDTKTANEKWGVGSLKFDIPVRESVAHVMNRRKRDEMDREFFLSQGASGKRFIPGMAASLLGAVSNPLDLGLMFVPFVGEEAAAAKATTVVGRIAAKRLITREALQELVPQAPRLTEAVINGVVGQTMFEIPNIVASAQDQANYGLGHAAFNIATAGGFSAALHGAGMLLSKLGRGTREEMARQALNQWVRDETVQVHQYVHVDEAAIWDKLRFSADESLAKAYSVIDRADLAKGMHDVAGPKVNANTPAAWIAADGSTAVGYGHALDPRLVEFVEKHGEDNVERAYHLTDGRVISEKEMANLTGVSTDELSTEYLLHGIENNMASWEESHFMELQESGMTRGQAAREILNIRDERAREAFFRNPDNQAKLDSEYKKSLEQFVENERIKFEQEKQGKFDQLKQQEIDRQIAEGKVLKPEQIQKSTPSAKHDGSQDAELDKDIEGLKKDLKIDEEAPADGGKTPEAEQKNVVEKVIAGIDNMIKSLDHDPTKMSLPLADLLTLGIGRPVLKGLLMAVKEGLVLFNDLTKAIDHAMEWLDKNSMYHGTSEDFEVPLMKESGKARPNEGDAGMAIFFTSDSKDASTYAWTSLYRRTEKGQLTPEEKKAFAGAMRSSEDAATEGLYWKTPDDSLRLKRFYLDPSKHKNIASTGLLERTGEGNSTAVNTDKIRQQILLAQKEGHTSLSWEQPGYRKQTAVWDEAKIHPLFTSKGNGYGIPSDLLVGIDKQRSDLRAKLEQALTGVAPGERIKEISDVSIEPKPKIESIQAAIDCVLKQLI